MTSDRKATATEFVHDAVQAYYDVYTDIVIEQTRNALQRDWGYTALNPGETLEPTRSDATEPGGVFAIPPGTGTGSVHTALHVTDVLTTIQERTPAQVLTTPASTRPTDTPLSLHVPCFESTAAARVYDLLTDDLGFEDITVTFNGATGYTVTVRDAAARTLPDDERGGVAAYVRGDLDADAVTGREHVTLPDPGTNRVEEHITLGTHGWGERVREQCAAVTGRVTSSTPGTVDRRGVIRDLTGLPGVSARTARHAVETISENPDAFAAGIVDLNDAVYDVVLGMADQVLTEHSAPVRLASTTGPGMYSPAPGSVNAATGLRVCRVPPELLLDAGFDPYTDGAVHWERVPGVPGTVTIELTGTTPPSLPVIAAVRDTTVDHAAGRDGMIPVSPGAEVTVPVGTAVYSAAKGYVEKLEFTNTA